MSLQHKNFTAAFLALVCAIPSARAQPLELAEVAFPAFNCLFAPDCRFLVSDSVARFSVPGADGTARLQSRVAEPGASGTPGEGLRVYLYRLDLSDLVTSAPGIDLAACVAEITLPFGTPARLDFDGDGRDDAAFVGTRGGSGSVGPTSIEADGDRLRVRISVCPGQSSYFFGMASEHAPSYAAATASLALSANAVDLEVRVPAAPRAEFIRGDVNGTGDVDIADAVRVLDHLFIGSRRVSCLDAADVDDSGEVDIADAVRVLGHLFLGGPAPGAPFPSCGVDPGADELDCAEPPTYCTATLGDLPSADGRAANEAAAARNG